MLQKLKNILIYLYEAFLFIVFPLWIPNGYYDLAGDKYDIFMLISLVMIAIFLILGIINFILFLIIHRKEKAVYHFGIMSSLKEVPSQYVIQLITVLFFISLTVSTLLSDYREQAFVGTPGWYMGFFTYMILFFIIHLLNSRQSWNAKITVALELIGSFVVNVIATLNRFRIYPVKGIENVRYFISTIGNSNWYAGYLCLFLFINIGIFLTYNFKNKISEIIFGSYIVLGSFCLWACGSKSVYVFAIPFFLLSLGYGKKLMTTFICFGISSEIFAFTYETIFHWDDSLDGSMVLFLVRNHIGIAVVISCTAYLWIKKNRPVKEFIIFTKLRPFLLLFLFLLPLVLLAVQIGHASLFSPSFGNGRGFIWNITSNVFKSLTLKQKLFGIGPDSLSFYLYDQQTTSELLIQQFGNSILTNCHSILLNNILNWGIIATILYLASNICIFILGYKQKKTCTDIVLFVLISAHVFGMFSFDNILFTPYIFCLWGYTLNMYRSFRQEQRS